MPAFKVLAEYHLKFDDAADHFEELIVEADSPEKASVEAVIRRKLPIDFNDGEPIYWGYLESLSDFESPIGTQLSRQRWPEVLESEDHGSYHYMRLGWWESDAARTLGVTVTPVSASNS